MARFSLLVLALSGLFVLCPVRWAQAQDETPPETASIEKPIAVLRALDKITARVEQIEVYTERPYKFGTIFITVHSCRVTPPGIPPEATAFIDVSELKAGQKEFPVFGGWMFASSPALSAMEHPVYDLWLMGCKD